MQTESTDNIGNITLQVIRDFIIDNELTENDTILLNSLNFDDIVLEYRKTYGESLPIPFYFLRVKIVENYMESFKIDKVKIIKDDNQRTYQDYLPFLERQISIQDISSEDRIMYRCGWCGNIVDYKGRELTENARQYKIELAQKFGNKIIEKPVDGYCCPNGPNE